MAELGRPPPGSHDRKSPDAQRRFDNIVTYLKHCVTNAASESINAKIQWVKYTTRGFRNAYNFVTGITVAALTCFPLNSSMPKKRTSPFPGLSSS